MLITHNQTIEADNDELKALMGGKGASLYRMTQEGMPVPPWINLPTSHCTAENAEALNGELDMIVKAAVAEMTEGRYGNADDPVLVSVRSGAAISMPGMMETVLNVGLNDKTIEGLAANTSEDFAWDCYRRFVAQYATIVLGMPRRKFDLAYQQAQIVSGQNFIPAEYSRGLVKYYRSTEMIGRRFPQNVWSQLRACIEAVFRSWNGHKAVSYRKIENIPDEIGTAVNIQRMVFGNRNGNSATGVYFTRNPNTGHRQPYGEFLPNAQGEDVVSGEFQTLPISDLPEQHREPLLEIGARLEKMYDNAVDIEFTVEDGKLWILQARTIKATPQAALRIILDKLADEEIDAHAAIEQVEALGLTRIESVDVGDAQHIGDGIACSPGSVTGRVFNDLDAMRKAKANGDKIIFVAENTTPDDIDSLEIADGILTLTGGPTCHAAVTARGWGKPCVVGFGGNLANTCFDHDDKTYEWGETLTIDGGNGKVFYHG